jgi:hypothetical protein
MGMGLRRDPFGFANEDIAVAKNLRLPSMEDDSFKLPCDDWLDFLPSTAIASDDAGALEASALFERMLDWTWEADAAEMAEGSALSSAGSPPSPAAEGFFEPPQALRGAASSDDLTGAAGVGGTTAAVAASGNQQIDGLLTGVRWSNATISYTDPDAAGDYQAGYSVDINANGTSAQNEGFGRISAQQLSAVHFALNEDLTQAGAAGFVSAFFTGRRAPEPARSALPTRATISSDGPSFRLPPLPAGMPGLEPRFRRLPQGTTLGTTRSMNWDMRWV